jgi:hypothetical protein
MTRTEKEKMLVEIHASEETVRFSSRRLPRCSHRSVAVSTFRNRRGGRPQHRQGRLHSGARLMQADFWPGLSRP